MRVTVSKCKTWLVSTWFSAGALMFIILLFQSIGKVYVPYTREAWEWLLPNLVPTLSLMAGIVALEARSQAAPGGTVALSFFVWTLGVSAFYLLVIVLTVLGLPFVSQAPGEKITFLKMSNLWLAPFQGLASAFLGVFFISKPQQEGTETSSGKTPDSGAGPSASG